MTVIKPRFHLLTEVMTLAQLPPKTAVEQALKIDSFASPIVGLRIGITDTISCWPCVLCISSAEMVVAATRSLLNRKLESEEPNSPAIASGARNRTPAISNTKALYFIVHLLI